MYLGVAIQAIRRTTRPGLSTTSLHISPMGAAISSKMLWKAFALGLLVEHVSGQGGPGMEMMRFSCSQLVIDRLDPLVNPGAIPVRPCVLRN